MICPELIAFLNHCVIRMQSGVEASKAAFSPVERAKALPLLGREEATCESHAPLVTGRLISGIGCWLNNSSLSLSLFL